MAYKLSFILFLLMIVIYSPVGINKTNAQLSPYSPIPPGSAKICTLDFQRPNTHNNCVGCLMSYRTELRQAYNIANHQSCSDQQIVNHWCNGGLGLQAIADCNALRYGICSQPPDRPCLTPTIPPGPPTLTPTPPATVNTGANPRGCGILYTAGVPSCWCNNGGGQGLCGNLPLDGPGGCRDLCERGLFTGPKGFTHCFIMKNGQECRSNDDGTYNYCLNRCLPGSPGFSQTIGCEYPNKTIFSTARFDTSCIISLSNSSNNNFFRIFQNWLTGLINKTDISDFVSTVIRVPGLQKAECNPRKENCNFE
ncbi:hypothetical protein A3B48_00755 [Candidatus Gottesmanbacteria bacterium RIFCSPLOWO2_01_FULL_40_10]|uniref:Uncharacterized protein n=1 Tax=Candidatus Gottesmanbacteria bacterium RIFCSPHIGHO2_01_FULL_40_15 TaxID=1798376 RepID=A0A1F5YZM7_9BACT|nr:MAG: hypothetical protein A2777_00420 [Candidatus Gottesmanbacteria bacterium RIFCSPHIGHO2_01_FULL_40_15]OGG20954.1 MAG: hypothetical protein A3B48_00755 [Candidatus Gottesmanbacteria bacterium RIFCSPLOWO2_01_FULL_40_10]OGG32076.1 MAG: hypothetical protein A3I80_00870 [Candidatus Gottesmanbacteria bacterium RIFCSPLOWO2_02_FULL_40_10]